jgi:HemY protein
MRPFLVLALLLALGALGALLGQWLIEDPGSVRILVRGWRVEMSGVTAAALILLVILASHLLLALLRLPRRIARELLIRRAAAGARAMLEERYREATRKLARLPKSSPLALPALVAAARCALASGHPRRAEALLDRAGRLAGGSALARSERAAMLLRAGRADEAVRLLETEGAAASSPAARRLLALALAADGQPGKALAMLPALAGVLPEERLAPLRRRLAEAVLAAASERTTLAQAWDSLPTAARRDPSVLRAYLRSLVAHGAGEEAARLIEARQAEHWDPALAELYARIDALSLERRLRLAEAWLAAHPEQPRLLLALGRLCRLASLWGKGEDYLRRAIAAGAGSDAWIELAELHLGQDDREGAIACFRNAIALLREQGGLAAVARLRRAPATVPEPEKRSPFGLPELPKAPS